MGNTNIMDATCSDIALAHALQPDITNSLISSFAWIAAADNPNVDGESLVAQSGGTINDVLTNETNGNQIVNYTVTPTDNTNSCIGDPFNVEITV